ncbi:cyclic AMP-dependent transcription factor ATF-4-like isoform X2 [Labeo rohita]|uniref:Cyclic AMP-dependent transcription factor ATF-4 n=2 Tax=Labeo rohita TaxID=84645 RepID=A0ABQ8MLA3_LABRO|nr:cyclic AMP-dependent transcription factor ATF-4 [Labeo rohita]KAI2663162.1 Cyclic AMP-dependent transcription factor ATF-4 [Labeo rohita]RXN32524.1 cyclic AMP-dependent transcription factor ATF-4-like isoform X2 [Labeo rohita]
MSVVSQMCLEDMGALFLGSSSLMADPFGPLLDEDEESALSEGSSSPLSSSYAESSSSFSPLSPSCPASVGFKSELLSLSWPPASALLTAQSETEQSKGDAFSGMDWMTEKLDLNDFDLDSLIGSCDSEEPPSSPEELLACLDTDMDLDLDSLPFGSSELGLPLPPLPLDLPLPEAADGPQEPVEIKSEPPSPAQSPDPTYTLELGSEVSVLQSAEIMLTPSHIVLLLAPKEEAIGGDSSDSDSGISVSGSPPHRPDPEPSPKPAGSSRTKPYSKPDPDAATAVTSRVKAAPGTPKVVEKKLKKMEQNKTAATRYRQKKRAEQETLSSECSDLEKRNRELKEKAESISREIQYLKDLMEEVRSAKNRRSKAKAQDAVSSG